MCGIAGFVHLDLSRPASPDALRRMCDSLRHRGPDGEGFYLQSNVALGHRRLAIIDTTSGHQPMMGQDEKHCIVFNGEIYNYIELRDELIEKGYRFRTQSDTEVILAAYDQWGQKCVDHFNGAWSFVIFDQHQQQLFCSRDRLGEKPLFYAEFDNTFFFASELKALFAYGVPQEINIEVLDAYLCFTYVPAPHTFFKNIYKLKAGHNLLLKHGQLSVQCYWDVPLIDAAEQRLDEKNILEEFESLFHDSVRIRMRSDVPFGAFLSGGLDSASVVSSMSQQSTSPISTFTAGFAEREFDERELALAVAEKFGTRHTMFEIGAPDSGKIMQTIAGCYDEPFGDSSALPSYLVAGLARKHVTVVLTGDGGDELLSGYTIHQGEKFAQTYSKIPALLARHALPKLVRSLQSISPSAYKNALVRCEEVLRSSSMDFYPRLLNKQNGFRSDERVALLRTSSTRPAIEYIHDALQPVSGMDSFAQLNYWLTKVALPDDMLTKVDRASMAQSVEARLPFLDHRLVELLWNVNMNVRLKGYTRKHILRATIGQTLPPQLLRARKRGFVLPLRDWLRQGEKDELSMRIDSVCNSRLFHRSAVENIRAAHVSGERDAANALWTLGMLSFSIPDSPFSQGAKHGSGVALRADNQLIRESSPRTALKQRNVESKTQTHQEME